LLVIIGLTFGLDAALTKELLFFLPSIRLSIYARAIGLSSS
jgi:hypothetical protein